MTKATLNDHVTAITHFPAFVGQVRSLFQHMSGVTRLHFYRSARAKSPCVVRLLMITIPVNTLCRCIQSEGPKRLFCTKSRDVLHKRGLERTFNEMGDIRSSDCSGRWKPIASPVADRRLKRSTDTARSSTRESNTSTCWGATVNGNRTIRCAGAGVGNARTSTRRNQVDRSRCPGCHRPFPHRAASGCTDLTRSVWRCLRAGRGKLPGAIHLLRGDLRSPTWLRGRGAAMCRRLPLL